MLASGSFCVSIKFGKSGANMALKVNYYITTTLIFLQKVLFYLGVNRLASVPGQNIFEWNSCFFF